MLIKSQIMHIDTTDNVTMACEAAFSACPISSLGLVFVLAYRTLATCASFRASEAHDASLFGFVGEVVDILTVFPQGHALVVVTARITVAHTMGIANEERANLELLAEVDHFAGGFVAQIADTAFCSCLDLVLGSLQLSPSSRMRLASGLLFRQLAKLLGSLSLERPNATACDNHGLPCVGRDGCQVDFTQIDCCVNRSWCFFGFLRLNTDMQLKAIVPDQATGTALLRQCERSASFAHRQDNPPILTAYCLSRPLDRIEAFFSPWISHFHLGMALTKLTCGLDVGKKGMHNHLDRLTMQSKLAFGRLLQLIAPRPLGMVHSRLSVDLSTEVPDFGGFHLRISKYSKHFFVRLQSVNVDCFHKAALFSLFVFSYLQRSIFEYVT